MDLWHYKKLPTHRGDKRTNNKLSQLFKIISGTDLFLFHRYVSSICIHYIHMQGRIQDLHHGGGGATDDVGARTSRARSPKSLTARVQGPLKVSWKLSGGGGGGDGFSYYLSLIVKYYVTKWDKKQIRSNVRGVFPPLYPPLTSC